MSTFSELLAQQTRIMTENNLTTGACIIKGKFPDTTARSAYHDEAKKAGLLVEFDRPTFVERDQFRAKFRNS